MFKVLGPVDIWVVNKKKMAQRSISDFFSRDVITKVNETEPSVDKFLFENLSNDFKKVF